MRRFFHEFTHRSEWKHPCVRCYFVQLCYAVSSFLLSLVQRFSTLRLHSSPKSTFKIVIGRFEILFVFRSIHFALYLITITTNRFSVCNRRYNTHCVHVSENDYRVPVNNSVFCYVLIKNIWCVCQSVSERARASVGEKSQLRIVGIGENVLSFVLLNLYHFLTLSQISSAESVLMFHIWRG